MVICGIFDDMERGGDYNVEPANREEMGYIIMEWTNPTREEENQYIIMREMTYIIMEQNEGGAPHYNGTDEPDEGGRKSIHYNEGNDVHYNGIE